MTPQGETCGCRDGFMLDTDLKSCKQDLSWKAPRYKEDHIECFKKVHPKVRNHKEGPY